MVDNAQRVESEPVRVAVIIGSTREGRVGEPIAKWFARMAQERPGFDIDLVDLAEAQLPVVLPDTDENLPAAVTELSARLAAADGFVVVTPEYNHSFPASLKNAIDWFYDEWQAKPVGFVSYGGRAQGIRAVEQLRQVFGELHAPTMRNNLSFDLGGGDLDADGLPVSSTQSQRAVGDLLDQLAWWARALRVARAQTPYPSPSSE
ncbi:NAD(P)H-dependent oxidoreductase [Natronosporangium hydrolyticum]|uniref:NAD(P)H-dependent oxidoreductase n=1 Tax=Natronosporangium hydrolyticum TaxID=2811111 RepID=A0A895YBC2_9ACTN|nr:NAD(P)H-dependent oxidoreductase [Natronosporangium hydrolyticum]QSB15094.1 NAD(P)H-dependent oxidoreductase [Natronosporangium hydrolyticum]